MRQTLRPGARPASITPARAKAKDETQAFVEDVTFKCYDADVVVPKDGSVVCPEEP